MVRPRIFLPPRKGHRVLNFCHHKAKTLLSLSLAASLHVSLGGLNFNSEIAIFALRRFAKALKLHFVTSLSCRVWSQIIAYVWMNFAHFLFSIQHLNMFAQMPVRTGFGIELSLFARIFLTSRAFFFLYYFWFFAHLDWISCYDGLLLRFGVGESEGRSKKVKFEVLFLYCLEKVRILLQPS